MSGDGPSATATDFPLSSSIVTIRRTDAGASIIEFRPHHHEGHETARARVGPAVPIAELHHHVARLHHDLAAAEHEYAFAGQQDAVIDGLGLVDWRAEGVLAAAIPHTVGALARRMQRYRGAILCRIVTSGFGRRLHDAQVSSRCG